MFKKIKMYVTNLYKKYFNKWVDAAFIWGIIILIGFVLMVGFYKVFSWLV